MRFCASVNGIASAGLRLMDIACNLGNCYNIKHQADGATVYIRQVTSNNHRVLVENTRGQIVTYMKDVTKHGLKNLARNYGWR